MATGKRYYWIKLKDSFLTSDTVDYLMGKPDGANYVVLYQCLCLKTINTEGRLERQIGEVIIPYDIEKIQRDCKWFSIDTVKMALLEFQKLGLIYQDDNGILTLSNLQELIGTETDYAAKKRRQRGQIEDNGGDIVPIENRERDKRLDIRDKRLEIDEDEEADSVSDIELIRQKWNEIPHTRDIDEIIPCTHRWDETQICLHMYGREKVLEAIQKVANSEFIKRNGDANFDTYITRDKIQKLREGNYDKDYSKPAEKSLADQIMEW